MAVKSDNITIADAQKYVSVLTLPNVALEIVKAVTAPLPYRFNWINALRTFTTAKRVNKPRIHVRAPFFPLAGIVHYQPFVMI